MSNVRNFTLKEFCDSDKAKELGVDNTLPDALESVAMATLEMLQDIRDHLSAVAGRDVPVVLSSGYRCQRVNRAVGSDDTSDHLKAMAADIRAPAFGTPTQIVRELARNLDALGIGQLILEHPDSDRPWVHVSTRKPSKAINRVITITAKGTFAGIQA